MFGSKRREIARLNEQLSNQHDELVQLNCEVDLWKDKYEKLRESFDTIAAKNEHNAGLIKKIYRQNAALRAKVSTQ